MNDRAQGSLSIRIDKLNRDKWISLSFRMDQWRQRSSALRLAANRVFNQLFEIVAGQRCKNDLLHCRSSFANRFEFAHQWMAGIDFVVSISTNQHQVPQIRLSQEILEHIECCQIEPLQVVEEERDRKS